jgi:hypothetical protein
MINHFSMAKTVNEAFAKFTKDIVNLVPERTTLARSSRDWLIGQLTSLPDKINDFPKLYDGMHIKFGSFARNTKVRPLDDIDLMLTFSAEGTKYDTIEYGKNYTLNVPESAIKLRNLCNDEGTLNSIRLVNKIVSSLGKIEQYKAADRHRRQEAAVLKLTSYEWNFDIVPAFYTDTEYYIIPDGSGGWKASNPKIDQDRIDTSNQTHNGTVSQLIRTLKYWNNRAAMTTIPSYLLENIIITFCDGKASLNTFIDINMINFWLYLKNAIYNSFPDPKGFQGDLNELAWDERIGISEKANQAYTRGMEAYKFETEELNHQKAIAKWREIFGDNFPIYE